jgi:protein-S-isoprenylcysteine O-methyltransferase Ste14
MHRHPERAQSSVGVLLGVASVFTAASCVFARPQLARWSGVVIVASGFAFRSSAPRIIAVSEKRRSESSSPKVPACASLRMAARKNR